MRVKWIDNAKGIAMLCVILGHMGNITIGSVNIDFVYSFHLTIFFLLSGYTLKPNKLNKEYVNKKFRRLMIPYFYTSFCIILMDIINNVFYYRDGRISNVTSIIGKDITRSFFASGKNTYFASIDIGTRIGAIWFLPAMFFAILITQWVINKTDDYMKRWMIVLSLVMLGYISSEFIWLPFSILTGMVASGFIMLGYYFRQFQIFIKLKKWHYILYSGIVIIGVYKQYDLIEFSANIFPDILLSSIVGIASSILIIKLSMYTEKSKLLSFIGRNSMIYLCVHLFALETLGIYFNDLIQYLHLSEIPGNFVKFLLHVCLTTAVTCFILTIKKIILNPYKHNEIKMIEKRDLGIDIMKGILIISMLVGYYSIDGSLRKIIYSCHMVAFVFLSGYFFKTADNIKESLKALMVRFIVPYVGCCCLDFIIHLKNMNGTIFIHNLKNYLIGISFSKKLFSGFDSIGPIYFVLLLFLVRFIYLILDYYIFEESYRVIIVIVLAFLGVYFGNHGMWLPWSFDCALYMLLFYMIAVYCKKYHILQYIKNNYISYFVLSTIWAYMIYKGSMELAIRQYKPYGIVILGAISGTILLYMLSEYIANNMTWFICKPFILLGECTLYILIIHTILDKHIQSWLSEYFDDFYIYHMVLSLLIQLVLGVIVGIFIKNMKKNIMKRYFSLK